MKAMKARSWAPSAACAIGQKSETIEVRKTTSLVSDFSPIAQPGRAGLPISALLARFNEPNAVQLGKAEPFANSTGRGVPVAEETLHAILEGDAIEVK